jgi:hypothetical protein
MSLQTNPIRTLSGHLQILASFHGAPSSMFYLRLHFPRAFSQKSSLLLSCTFGF